jgi:hypothetical protein
MAILSLKISAAEDRRLSRSARAAGKTKSAYARSLLIERIVTTDDLLRALETGALDGLAPRSPRRRRRAAA